MRIDFDAMEETIIPHMRGGEKEVAARMYTDELGKIMRGRLIPGASIGMHTHSGSSEVIFITSGSGSVICDGEKTPVYAGLCHYCPEGHSHSLINDSEADLEFLAVVPQQ